jgi:DNA invertase Pin-like site-specific DNA recombinase
MLGTQSDNMRDAASKGRLSGPNRRGERNSRAVLTEAQVRDVRRRRRDGEAMTRIARSYEVSVGAIQKIVYGKSWASLPEVA